MISMLLCSVSVVNIDSQIVMILSFNSIVTVLSVFNVKLGLMASVACGHPG